MKNTSPSTAAGLLVAALFLIPAAIQASLLTNQTTGATIFNDNFESGTVNELPVAITGTWTKYGTGDAVVLNGAWSPDNLNPYWGTKMLGFWSASTVGLWGKGIAANSGSNDVIKMEIAFCVTGPEVGIYTKGGTDDLLHIGLFGPTNTDGYTPNHVYVRNGDTNAWMDTGFEQNPNAWNTLAVTHLNGTKDWAISVNGGNAYNATGFAAGTSKSWDGFLLYNDLAGNVSYFDAVPEPASLGLLALGALGMLRRRRG